MLCDINNMYSTLVMCCIFLLSSIIIYCIHSKIQYLEDSISKQNEVLTNFISNFQKSIVSSSSSSSSSSPLGEVFTNKQLQSIKEENDKIVVSDSDNDSDDSDDGDDDSDDDTNEQHVSEID